MVTFTLHSAVFPPCVVTVTVADPALTAFTTALLLSSASDVTLTTVASLLSQLAIPSRSSGVAVSSFSLSVPDDTFNTISVSDSSGALNSGVTGSPVSSACTDAFETSFVSTTVSSTVSVSFSSTASSTVSVTFSCSASSTVPVISSGSASSTDSVSSSVCSSCSSARVIILQFSTGTRFDINIAAHINARILLCISFSSLDFFLCMNHHNIFSYGKIYFFARILTVRYVWI